MTKEVMKQALEVLKSKDTWGSSIREAKEDAIKALEEALKQEHDEPDDLTIAYMAGLYDGKKQVKQEQDEPVGKFAKFTDGIWREVTDGSAGVPLYTHPKEWVGLTDEDIENCFDESCHLKVVDPKGGIKGSVNIFEVGRAIVQLCKERNT